jgi:hypothetical protein
MLHASLTGSAGKGDASPALFIKSSILQRFLSIGHGRGFQRRASFRFFDLMNEAA